MQTGDPVWGDTATWLEGADSARRWLLGTTAPHFSHLAAVVLGSTAPQIQISIYGYLHQQTEIYIWAGSNYAYDYFHVCK